jgi:hypothetical protein
VSRRTFIKLEIAFLLAIPVWAAVTGCIGLGPDPFSMVYLIAYFYLTTGWAFFLSRVAPSVEVDWPGVGIAVVSLLGLAFGLHFFCAWLYREIAKKSIGEARSRRATSAVAQLEVSDNAERPWHLVLVFVAGISAVGGVHQLVWLRTRP